MILIAIIFFILLFVYFHFSLEYANVHSQAVLPFLVISNQNWLFFSSMCRSVDFAGFYNFLFTY